ncbi:hypothetical protein HRI_001235600 [Hibiscus trionum]|uniref:Retroviral polymerase SH3-like domain-containing protein n=1 Tax=Hibiscus trionum TaxID=183268 RepID=A0A9W7LT30_HIBTR|nr:hypothetical protein HRI_001235600 [Hibiscus trionum]
MARSLLKAKKLPNRFWGEAVATSVYLLNISPTRVVLNQTPFEAWMGKKPRVSHLKVFHCITYALVTSRTKLDEKSQKCIFIGYSSLSKAYRLYNLINGKVIISRDVVFNEEMDVSLICDKGGMMNEVPTDFEVEQPANSTPSSPANSAPSSPSATTSSNSDSIATHASNSSSESETPPRNSTLLKKLQLHVTLPCWSQIQLLLKKLAYGGACCVSI